MSARILIVNADDFGFTRDVNAGIVEAYRRGILRATSLMANSDAFDDAVKLAEENPGLDVGCHLALVQGSSALPPHAALPASLGELVRALALGRLPVYDELAAQVRRIVSAGLRPSHLDTHKHTHLLPPVLNAVARVAKEFGIPWVRRPFDLPATAGTAPWLTRLSSRGLGALRGRFHAVLSRHGCRTTDYFAGFQLTGRFRAAELVKLVRALPPGITEFMCHPGRCTGELRAARTRLKESREAELEALIAAETLAAVRQAGVELRPFRDV